MGLMTGQYQQRFGIYDNIYGEDKVQLFLRATLLPALFQKAGYRTALVGKWHLSGHKKLCYETAEPLDRGFDEFVGIASVSRTINRCAAKWTRLRGWSTRVRR